MLSSNAATNFSTLNVEGVVTTLLDANIKRPRTGGNVRVESVNTSYWKQCFNCGKRVKEANGH